MPDVELPIDAQPSMRSLDRATLFRICSWADEGEIERAGDSARRLLQEGVYDYQLVVLWLAYRFARDGMTCLGDVLKSATQQLLRDLDSVAPSDRDVEGRTLDRALAWLASNVAQRIHFHSKVRDDVWSRWLEGMEPETLDEVSARVDQAVTDLTAALGHADVAVAPGELRKLDRRVRGSFGGIVEEVAKRRAAVADEAKARREEAEPMETPASSEEERPELAVESRSVWRSTEAELPPGVRVGSERLRVLQRKLKVFQVLAQRGALRHAAIVARDVEQELAQFDPLLYLPELFEGYLSALLEVGPELEGYMGEADGLDQRALERLYHADPLRFLERATLEDAG